jgi:hypothetical protein
MKTYLKAIITFIFLIFVIACKPKEIVPIPPVLDTITVSETTISTVRFSSAITDIGNQYISDYGFVFSENNAIPTLADSKISFGAITAANVVLLKFSEEIKGLKISSNYYARAYATISTNTFFGPAIIFKTADLIQPTIKTEAVLLVFTTTAKLQGIIETKGTFDVSEYGILWSASNNLPTISDSKSSKVGTLGVYPTIYSEDAINLIPNTNHYFRAFVVSNGITSYGNMLTFKTVAITQPTIKTLEANTTTTSSVKIKGLVEFGGNSDKITEFGICWSQRFTTPTLDHSKAKILDNITIFPKTYSVDIYSLSSSIELYYRAYIISNGVVTYGDVKNYNLEIGGFPTLSTGNSTSISATSQRIQSIIITKGSYPITEYGICWNLINDYSNTFPITCKTGVSIQDSPTNFPVTFSIDAINLTVGTLYFYRAFVVSNGITTYGNEKSVFNAGSSK